MARECMTQQEVGDQLGVTKMRICQIENRALAKLRKRLIEAGLEYQDLNPEAGLTDHAQPLRLRED